MGIKFLSQFWLRIVFQTNIYKIKSLKTDYPRFRKHAQRITEKLEDLMDQVTDIARDQETLQSETWKQAQDLKIITTQN